MRSLSIFNKSSTFDGIYVILMVNRLQLLYYFFILPMYLVYPYMIWGIIVMGVLSQFNIMLFSKWFSSVTSPKDYQGFVKLFGEPTVRIFAFLGWMIILVKITIITLSYIEIVHQFIFPGMNMNWLIFFIFLLTCYIAGHGMEKTIRFVVISFLLSVWMLLLFIPFYIPPIASLQDLLPIIPTEWPKDLWNKLVFLWSCYSGPELLVFMLPWLSPEQKILKYLTIANAFSVMEYVIVFVASLFFFGSNYLLISEFPVINMIRYLQSPVTERLDMIMISIHMIHFAFAASIFKLFLYGGARIVMGTWNKPSTLIGFMASCSLIFVCTIIVKETLWMEGTEENIGLMVEIGLGALTYLLVPSFLLMASKRRRRV
ncbi:MULTISPECIES: GerAB/ArcD/ProY family transporter [unclassified Paenibacillus]|uniref:GerAB/ArcD/ProY family transporter n=1 Tax=unclassified Paenibacillus TaxID=185978 RepID=UPI001AE43675|nr:MULTISPECIES: GerAB/ArcD/ProY family transporter [unclassified Paenibacillus]MBP1155647.1 hypothetical protein [Paenibacillus sp. PvP091]MBP1168967.1 hypothetical protein [Paenibacillus sp. PvR098]MBP2439995.1 hypothetical protein [Paenibacillus sp. PvP052]